MNTGLSEVSEGKSLDDGQFCLKFAQNHEIGERFVQNLKEIEAHRYFWYAYFIGRKVYLHENFASTASTSISFNVNSSLGRGNKQHEILLHFNW